ncbi:MAG: hypothetical protein HFJ43_03680 [Clostridia bacterium]|nr:hypothetical protein [Clostridia bacterium]
MLILNCNDYNKLNDMIYIEFSNIQKISKLFSNQKNILTKYFNIVLTSMSDNSNFLVELNRFLEGFNVIFDKINASLLDTDNLLEKLKDLKNNFSDGNYDYNNIEQLCNSYNNLYIEKYTSLIDNIDLITEFIENVVVSPIYEKSMENTRNIFSAQLSSLKEYEEKNSKKFETPDIKTELSREEILDEITNNTTSSNKKEISDKAAEKILENLEKITENSPIKDDLEEFSNTIPNNNENKSIEKDNYDNNRVTKLPLQDNNTLIISEKEQLVYLPFKVEDLKNEYLKKSKKYSGLVDLINHEYIVPINRYKNTVTSRFREAYFLMTSKEKSSTLSGLELGLEVAFNYSLYPAIISACKSLEELDSYLYALENKDLSKFTAFKINFELLPKNK